MPNLTTRLLFPLITLMTIFGAQAEDFSGDAAYAKVVEIYDLMQDATFPEGCKHFSSVDKGDYAFGFGRVGVTQRPTYIAVSSWLDSKKKLSLKTSTRDSITTYSLTVPVYIQTGSQFYDSGKVAALIFNLDQSKTIFGLSAADENGSVQCP